MTYRNLINLLTLIVLFSVMLHSNASAETFFFVNYYVVGHDAYDGATPLNGVIRIPEEKMESSDCIEAIGNIEEKSDKIGLNKCKPLMAELLRNYGKRVADLLDFDDELKIRKIATIEMGNNGKAFLYVESFYGGSGGGRNDWSLYLIRNDKDNDGHAVFFYGTPFLSGTEVTPGGNVWYETSCGKQDYEKCAERIFYPKQNAFQILFTEIGVSTRPLPLYEKNPK